MNKKRVLFFLNSLLIAGFISVMSSFSGSNRLLAQPIIVIDSTDNVTCKGLSDGAAYITASGLGTLTYSWSSGSTNEDATGLAAGTHTVEVTDLFGTSTETVTITEPAAPLTSTLTVNNNVSCDGGNDGSITAAVSGGTPAYTYMWSSSAGTDATANGLSADTYTVTITDANMCTHTDMITVTQPPPITHTISFTPVLCHGGSTGTATVTVSGGSPGYSYSWSPTGGTNATAAGLPTNTYTVTITDSNLCTHIASITVTEPTELLTGTVTPTHVTCNGSANGMASVSPSGGTTPYTYSWSSSAGTNSSASNLAPNTYTVTVTDNHGCTKTATTTITQPTTLTVTASASQHVSCNGGNNGIASVSASGGTTPYTYSWSSSAGTNSIAVNLTANTYTVTVRDNKACTRTATVTITQPPVLTITVTAQQHILCNGSSTGIASVSALGGVSPYTYSWSPAGGTKATASNLVADTYTVTVRDNKGCSQTGTATITQPASAVSISSLSSTGSNCGQPDGTASATATGGTSPYTYSWSPSGGTNSNASGLTANDYTITIRDNNACIVTGTVNVPNASGFTASITSFTMASCKGSCDGQAVASVTGGTSPFTYNWSTGDTTAGISNLCSAVYSVTVTDFVNCTSIVSRLITEPDSVVITATGVTTICNGQTTLLSASATGGDANYFFTWSPGGATTDTLSVSPTSTASYTITATDGNGCAALPLVVLVTVNQALAVNITGTSAICIGNSASLTAVPSGGSGNYTYLWSLGGATTSSITDNPTSQTIYTVTLSDDCGSSAATSSFTVDVNSPPVVAFAADDTVGCDPHTVVFTNQSNPIGTSWFWQFGDGDTSLNNNPTHTYTSSGFFSVTLTITNAGCSNTASNDSMIEVFAKPLASFTMDPSGAGFAPGTAFSFSSTSVGAISWEWHFGDLANSTDTQANTQFTYSEAGTYIVTLIVVNSIGCSDTAQATINIEGGEYALFIPNAFSPNGDGLNDEFGPEGVGIDLDNYQFFIFDRWGILIYYTEILGKKWDGKVSWSLPLGKVAKDPVQQDVLLWKVRAKDLLGEDHEESGTVTIYK